MTLALVLALLFAATATLAVFFALVLILVKKPLKTFFTTPLPPFLARSIQNPILEPVCSNVWEAEATFNPAVLYDDNKVHLLYRALGPEGISRVGYTSGTDGICFPNRLPYPIYTFSPTHHKFPHAMLRYNPQLFASGGGWGGCEDPRIVRIDDQIVLTFSAFQGWHSIRMGLTHINVDDFRSQNWNWSPTTFLSPADQVHKNWLLFPEKIDGKYTLITGITPHIQIEQYESFEEMGQRAGSIQSIYTQKATGTKGWEAKVRGTGPPPLKTKHGWLLLYHGHDKDNPDKYKLGAMLLDSNDPKHILYRAKQPLLAPDHWYENEGKPGVVYASGAIIKDGELFVYYGGADRVVCVAHAPLTQVLEDLMQDGHRPFTSTPLLTR